MKKIYLSHNRKDMDFKNKLYLPIRNSELNHKFDIILPHENSNESFNVRDLFFNHKIDILLAEVSFPSTGQGIELGWANANSIPTICLYKKSSVIAGSLKTICNNFIEYESAEDMIAKLSEILN